MGNKYADNTHAHNAAAYARARREDSRVEHVPLSQWAAEKARNASTAYRIFAREMGEERERTTRITTPINASRLNDDVSLYCMTVYYYT